MLGGAYASACVAGERGLDDLITRRRASVVWSLLVLYNIVDC